MAKVTSILSKLGGAEDFRCVVAAAATAKATLDRFSKRDLRLSCRGYLASIASRNGFDIKQVAVLEKAMDGAEADLLRPAVRQLMAAIQRFTPTSALRTDRMGPYMADAPEALGRLGVGRDALLYYAVTQVGQHFPAHFGNVDVEGEGAAALATAKAEWEAAREKIETFPLTIGPNRDLEVIGENVMPQPGGGVDVWVKLCFRCTNNAVTFTKDRAEHLAVWWLENVAPEEEAA